MNNSNNYNITISQPLLAFLEEANDDNSRFNKFEAYVYLLEAAAEAGAATNSNLLPGQFVTSLSELAEAWNWHRGNVRLFLNSLENLGALTMERQSKSTIITLPLSFDGDANPGHLLNEEERQWLRFIFGMAALDEFLDIFSNAIIQSQEVLTELVESKGPIAGEVGSRLRVMLNHLMLCNVNIFPSDPNLDEVLRELFVEECHGDLLQFYTLLSIGGFFVVGQAREEDLSFQVSDRAMSRLNEVISYYSPWLKKSVDTGAPDSNE
jgi:hypothetical protein